jgi:hypothetical protein
MREKNMFLTPHDLRVGNYINYENTTHVVAEIHQEKIIHYWLNSGGDGYVTSYKQILSIPISTHEIEKFGYNENEDDSALFEHHSGFSLLHVGDDFILTKKIDGKLISLHTVDFVHELQNLIFLLTKEKLTY